MWRRNKHGGSLSVRQQRGSTLHGPLVTIATQVQTRIEIKSQSSGFFRLVADDRCRPDDSRRSAISGHSQCPEFFHHLLRGDDRSCSWQHGHQLELVQDTRAATNSISAMCLIMTQNQFTRSRCHVSTGRVDAPGFQPILNNAEKRNKFSVDSRIGS